MSIPTLRYLTSFHPKQVPHFFTDILVVGSGLAGLRAALGVDPKLSVLVVTKGKLQLSNSLSEAAIYGAHAGQAASQEAAKQNATFCVLPLENPRVESTDEPLDVAACRTTRRCGSART